jgi:hypothetical protein
MTDRELFASYRATSHLLDIDFFLQHANQAVLRSDRSLYKGWLSLRAKAPKMPRKRVEKEYRRLQDRYRAACMHSGPTCGGVATPRFLATLMAVEHSRETRAGWLPFTASYVPAWTDTLCGDVVTAEQKATRLEVAA